MKPGLPSPQGVVGERLRGGNAGQDWHAGRLVRGQGGCRGSGRFPTRDLTAPDRQLDIVQNTENRKQELRMLGRVVSAARSTPQ